MKAILDRLLAEEKQCQCRYWITGQRRREAAKAILDRLPADKKQCQCRYWITRQGKREEAAKKSMLNCWLEGDSAAAESLDKDGERLRMRC